MADKPTDADLGNTQESRRALVAAREAYALLNPVKQLIAQCDSLKDDRHPQYVSLPLSEIIVAGLAKDSGGKPDYAALDPKNPASAEEDIVRARLNTRLQTSEANLKDAKSHLRGIMINDKRGSKTYSGVEGKDGRSLQLFAVACRLHDAGATAADILPPDAVQLRADIDAEMKNEAERRTASAISIAKSEFAKLQSGRWEKLVGERWENKGTAPRHVLMASITHKLREAKIDAGALLQGTPDAATLPLIAEINANIGALNLIDAKVKTQLPAKVDIAQDNPTSGRLPSPKTPAMKKPLTQIAQQP